MFWFSDNKLKLSQACGECSVANEITALIIIHVLCCIHITAHPYTVVHANPHTITHAHHTLSHIHTSQLHVYHTWHPHTITHPHLTTTCISHIIPTHYHTCTPTHYHTCTPTHYHTCTPTHYHTCMHTHTPSHIHTSQLHVYRTCTPHAPYIIEGFGNATRIDYGTGHEAKFMAFLCCLMKIGVVRREDAAAVVLKVVKRWGGGGDNLSNPARSEWEKILAMVSWVLLAGGKLLQRGPKTRLSESSLINSFGAWQLDCVGLLTRRFILAPVCNPWHWHG